MYLKVRAIFRQGGMTEPGWRIEVPGVKGEWGTESSALSARNLLDGWLGPEVSLCKAFAGEKGEGFEEWYIRGPARVFVPAILRELRESAGLTLAEVGEKLGKSTRAFLHAYESGRVTPSLDKLEEILKVYKKDINLVFGDQRK